MKTLTMSKSVSLQIVCCPNCGKKAERRFCLQQQITETACPACDYLLVNSSNGNVLEAYAPGLTVNSYP
jgi:hypothetical protein